MSERIVEKTEGHHLVGPHLKVDEKIEFTNTADPEIDSTGGSAIWKILTGVIAAFKFRDDTKGQDALTIDTSGDKIISEYTIDNPVSSTTGGSSGGAITRELGNNSITELVGGGGGANENSTLWRIDTSVANDYSDVYFGVQSSLFTFAPSIFFGITGSAGGFDVNSFFYSTPNVDLLHIKDKASTYTTANAIIKTGAVISTQNSAITSSATNGIIGGGKDHVIGANVDNGGILAGSGATLNHDGSVMLGGSTYASVAADTAHAENLIIVGGVAKYSAAPALATALDFAHRDYIDRPVIQKVVTDSPYTASWGEDIEVDCAAGAGGNITINLPTAVGNNGKTISITRVDGSANILTIDGATTETINGALTKIIGVQWDSLTLKSNGTNVTWR